MKLWELHILVEAVCPIFGINSEGEICYKPEATQLQKSQAIQIISTNLGSVIE